MMMKDYDESVWRDWQEAIRAGQPSAKDPADDLKALEEDLYVLADILKTHIRRFVHQLGQADHPLKRQKIRELRRLLASFR